MNPNKTDGFGDEEGEFSETLRLHLLSLGWVPVEEELERLTSVPTVKMLNTSNVKEQPKAEMLNQ